MQGCLKERDITCEVRKQEYEENKGEEEMSETKEKENKIVIFTKNTNIALWFITDKFGRIIESISCGSFEYSHRVEDVGAGISWV